MKEIICNMEKRDEAKKTPKDEGSLLKRLGWMVLLWSLGVLSLFVFAQIIRFIMNAVGLTVPS